MKRWTIKELEEKNDTEVIIGIISERLEKLNPYAPLAKRLRAIRSGMEKQNGGYGGYKE